MSFHFGNMKSLGALQSRKRADLKTKKHLNQVKTQKLALILVNTIE